MSNQTVRVSIEELYQEFRRVLDKAGLSEHRSALCAHIFTENTRDGVLSHGINRFPAFVDFVLRGLVQANAEPALVHACGAFERWDGHHGPGPLNAHFCMNRAIQLAREHAIGAVALRNTNHWMRGGTYGLQAADAGCIGICWTNTTALMPPWGSMEPRLGNNPLVICVPNAPQHILLDMSMSQFSFGRMAVAQQSAERLPVPGGFDDNGQLTDDPEQILRSKRPLPIGYWKGSGLALVLDCVVSALALGNSTCQIAAQDDETDVSQIFLAIDLSVIAAADHAAGSLRQIIDSVHSARALNDATPVSFPGERMSRQRATNSAKGVIVDADVWRSIQQM